MIALRWRCALGCVWAQFSGSLRLWHSCPYCGCEDVECESA